MDGLLGCILILKIEKQNSLLTKSHYKNGSITFKDVITTEQLVCGIVATPFVWEYQDKLFDMHFLLDLWEHVTILCHWLFICLLDGL